MGWLQLQEGFEEDLTVPLGRMVYGEVGHSYVALVRPEGAALVGKLVNTLKFTVKEIDPSTGLLFLVLLSGHLNIMPNYCCCESSAGLKTWDCSCCCNALL